MSPAHVAAAIDVQNEIRPLMLLHSETYHTHIQIFVDYSFGLMQKCRAFEASSLVEPRAGWDRFSLAVYSYHGGHFRQPDLYTPRVHNFQATAKSQYTILQMFVPIVSSAL